MPRIFFAKSGGSGVLRSAQDDRGVVERALLPAARDLGVVLTLSMPVERETQGRARLPVVPHQPAKEDRLQPLRPADETHATALSS